MVWQGLVWYHMVWYGLVVIEGGGGHSRMTFMDGLLSSMTVIYDYHGLLS